MAYLTPSASYDDVVQWETNDPGQTTGGAGGGANAQAQALLNRTKFINDRTWYSSTGTGGDDGNAGQPPQPKSNIVSDSTIGFERVVDTGTAGSLSIYYNGTDVSGTGTWKCFFIIYVTATGAIAGVRNSVGAGNSIIYTINSGYSIAGFAKRIA